MDFKSYQAIATLVKARLSDLELERDNLRGLISYFNDKADPTTEDGRSAFNHLNSSKNRLRAVEAALRKWNGVYKEFKTDMGLALDDSNAESRMLPILRDAAAWADWLITRMKK